MSINVHGFSNYRFRLYPTPEQEHLLANAFGQTRWVYNHYLEVRRTYYRSQGKGLRYIDTQNMLTRIKRLPRYRWLNVSNAQMLQSALRDLDRAYTNFFEKRAKLSRPRSRLMAKPKL